MSASWWRRSIGAVARCVRKSLQRMRKTPMGYEPLLPAHLCARMLLATPEGMDTLKLSKLAYLAEREYVKLRGMPLTCDELMVGVNGPYCREIANGLVGRRDKETWDRYIERRGGRIHLKAGVVTKDLDHLSGVTRTLADDLVGRFAEFSGLALVEWMRSPGNATEWEATLAEGPLGERPRRIPIEALADAVGIERRELADSFAEIRSLRVAMSRE